MSENPYQSTMQEPSDKSRGDMPAGDKAATDNPPRYFPWVPCVVLAIGFVASLLLVPYAYRFFREFEIDLPVLTRLAIHPAVPYVYLGILMIVVGLFLFAKSPSVVRVGSLLALVLGGAMIVVETLAIVMPLLTLIQNLS